jgi:nucleoside-diphosphate-sugar epimerase
MSRALVIGGSGPTGPHIADELAACGYQVTILHRGVHEDPALARYEHIHADPHFQRSLEPAIENRRFELVVATYGRLAMIARLFAGRCERFVAIGGIPIYPGYLDPSSTAPSGSRVGLAEDGPLVDPDDVADPRAARFASKLLAAERAVLEQHGLDAYRATIIRYPLIYGPRSPVAREWSIIKRVKDRRPAILLPDGGLSMHARCAARNAAHCVVLAAHCDGAAGEILNCVDEEQFSLRQWVELIVGELGAEPELVGVSGVLRGVAAHLLPLGGTVSEHAVVDGRRARDVLGYPNPVPARAALAETVRWYVEHPPDVSVLPAFDDPFDYETEDRVLAALDALAKAFPLTARVPVHAYPHPRQPGLADHMGR